MYKKFLPVLVLFFWFSILNTVFAENIKTEYWHNDHDFPIWVIRQDGSMLIFKISSARECKFVVNGRTLEKKSGIYFISMDAYDVDSDGSVTEYPILGSKGTFSCLYNKNNGTYFFAYPITFRFPNGQEFYVENRYQRKICDMLVNESFKHDVVSIRN